MKTKLIATVLASGLLVASMAGCASNATQQASTTSTQGTATRVAASSSTVSVDGSALDTSDMFSDRDLEQTADTSNAKTLTVSDNQDLTISEEGVYVVSGTATNATIKVEAPEDAKVQIVLNGITITNSDSAAIYVTQAVKVFVTTASGTTNTLTTTGAFAADGETNVDGVIFSKSDLTLNGQGTLSIYSSDNGVVSKDDLKITGGTINVNTSGHGFQAHDSVRVADGVVTVNAQQDGIHAEDADDTTTGYVYVVGGTLNLNASGQGIQATTVAQVDGGEITISGTEGIEATYIQVNGGSLNVTATDDGLNATTNSSSYTPTVDIKGGSVTINMGQGDTDGIDSNGNITISGGTVDVTCQSPFDFDGTGTITGGTVTANGSQVTELSNQMMGGGAGGAMGGNGGQMGGQMGGNRGGMQMS